jgi:hypothetical protein
MLAYVGEVTARYRLPNVRVNFSIPVAINNFGVNKRPQ